jgi:hypothetical protein
MAEQRLGSFQAVKPGGINGGTVYQAFVTAERIVAVKIGGQLDGGKAFTVHLGALGAIIGHFLDKGVQKKRAALRASFEGKTLDELLRLDAKNFEVRLDALEGAEAKASKLAALGAKRVSLTLLKVGEKPIELQLVDKAQVAAAIAVLEQALPGRFNADQKLRS